MKKRVLSFALCLLMIAANLGGWSATRAEALTIEEATVVSKDITQIYPGDFGTEDNQESNRIYFSMGVNLKAGQYINFTMNATMPVEQFGIMYDCENLGGMKFGAWTGPNAGTFRFSILVPYATSWFDLIMYTNIGVPKGTPITVSDITVSEGSRDFSDTGTGYLGVGENVVPFAAKKGDVVTFDIDIVNGNIPNRGGMSTCLWFWQNTTSDKSKMLHGNVYTTPEGQQKAEVCLTEDLESFYITIDVQNVPDGALTTVMISNVHSGDWHDDNRLVNFTLTPYEKRAEDGDNYYYTVAAGTDLTALNPTFDIASDASVNKESGSVQDFTNPVSYTVTSPMGRTRTYTVTVYALDQISDADKSAVQNITDRANALPDKIAATDSAWITQANQLKADLTALTVLQNMLLDDSVRTKILQAAKQAEDANLPIRITCVGDSITQGVGTEDASTQSYPAQLQTILGDGYQILNAGVSGAQVRSNSSMPYTGTMRYDAGLAFEPNIVIIMLGTNDAAGDRCTTPETMAEFQQDYKTIVDAYRALETAPKIYLALPPYCYGSSGGTLLNLKAYVNPMIAVFAEENDLELIDMNAFTAGHVEWFPDGLHPSAEGYTEMATEFSKFILAYGEAKLSSISVNGSGMPGFDANKFTYETTVPMGAEFPVVTGIATQMDAEVNVAAIGSTLPSDATITVTSGDGRAQNVYTVHVSETALEDIKQRVEAEIASLTPSNEMTAEDIMAIVNRFIGSSSVTANWAVSYAKEPSVPGVNGSITGQIRLSAAGESDQLVSFHLVIPAIQDDQNNGTENGTEGGGGQESGTSSGGTAAQTGDDMDITLYCVTMIICLAGMMVVVPFIRKLRK